MAGASKVGGAKRQSRTRKIRGGSINEYIKNEPYPMPHGNLIISTGDISDTDGFYALAEYAKSGADVLFIMNYPAYLNVTNGGNDIGEPGLGYVYSADKFSSETNDSMKQKLTDLAFAMSSNVWNEAAPEGQLYYCIGGINAINPFSSKSLKDETIVYNDVVKTDKNLNSTEGIIYNAAGNENPLNLAGYDNIYIDFNGSMAFLDNAWVAKLKELSNIRGVFIMGGVYADGSAPLTMPSIAGVLNRFSAATMNQLYHPTNTGVFFDFIKNLNIPTYVITNNVVKDFETTVVDPNDSTKKNKTNEGWEKFLKANRIDNPFLHNIANAYYNSKYGPPRKPFDFYTAVIVNSILSGKSVGSNKKYLFYSKKDGMTFVSGESSWLSARDLYIKGILSKVKADSVEILTSSITNDNSFPDNMKKNYLVEINILNNMTEGDVLMLEVTDTNLNQNTDGTITIAGVSGGKKKNDDLKKTDEKVKVGGRELNVHVNKRGTKHVKRGGEFVKLSEALKNIKNKKNGGDKNTN